jgi:FAD/FMN-containing dehydrogenase/Fe-S oxidoreductase
VAHRISQGAAALAEAGRKLSRAVRGEVRFDGLSRSLYATDASNYRIIPLGVVLPRDRDDVEATVRIAAEHGIPLLPRGGGTSLAGNAVGAALVLDFTKHMNRVLDFDPGSRRVRVEPGVIAGRLNRMVAGHGLVFGPDPATKDRAAIGGMIGNNSCGAHSLAYGKTVDHVESLVLLLADGETLVAARDGSASAGRGISASSERLRALVNQLQAIAAENAELVRARYPRIPRRISGYNLDELLPENGFNLAGLLTGSEGTLAMTLEATLRLNRLPPHRAIALLAFDDVPEALDAVAELVDRHGPSALELLDRTLIERAGALPHFRAAIRHFDRKAGGTLLLEVAGEEMGEVRERLKAVERTSLPGLRGTLALAGEEEQEEAWALRESALGVLWQGTGDAKPVAGVEDTAVPPAVLGRYVRELLALLRRHRTPGAFYGHAGEGCLHIRVLLDLKAGDGPGRLRQLTEEVCGLVLAHGGSLSGEHGDGIARSELLGRMFGSELIAAFRRVKSAFDPRGLLNPGKIVDPYPLDHHLRFDPSYRLREPATFYDWSEREGIGRAVEACIGVGKCRKLDAGAMCPSYMVTREEAHSTRGRANALREALRGELLDGLADPLLAVAMDLCLSCKACKRECPTGVDMARLKSEFMAHYRSEHGTSLRPRIFASIRRWSAMASLAPGLAHFAAAAPAVGPLLRAIAGIHPRRSLPRFASEPFRRRFARRQALRASGSASGAPATRTNPASGAKRASRRVVLLDDTFNNYQEPQILEAAVEVLERAGYQVTLPSRPVCCGRPLYSLGFLDEARRGGRELLQVLADEIDAEVPIVGCEPSCLLTFRDELPDLLPGPETRRLARSARLLDELLVEGAYTPGALDGQAIVHRHCHAQALAGMQATARLLAGVEGLNFEILDSGCCGMAGSFGYEREHYEVSMAVGERVLLPRARSAPPHALIVADGTSCRHQIRDGAGREAIHIAELLHRCKRDAGGERAD